MTTDKRIQVQAQSMTEASSDPIENEAPNENSQTKWQALFDSIPQTGLKCDILFLVIKNRIAEEPDYVKKLRVVFQFNITKDGQLASVWTCDTKSSIEGDVYKSTPKFGLKADCTLTVDDDDWVKIMVGKLNPQRAFMMSKFKIKGNIMLLQKLHSIWFEMRRKGKTPELDLIQEIMVNEPLMPNLKSEAMAIEIVQRIVKMPNFLHQINASIQFDIYQRDKLMTQYSIGMYPDKKPEFKRLFNANLPDAQSKLAAALRNTQADLRLSLEDDDFVLLIYGFHKLDHLIQSSKLKLDGRVDLIDKVRPLLEQAPIMSKL